jgi:hypothetical protein
LQNSSLATAVSSGFTVLALSKYATLLIQSNSLFICVFTQVPKDQLRIKEEEKWNQTHKSTHIRTNQGSLDDNKNSTSSIAPVIMPREILNMLILYTNNILMLMKYEV